MRNHSSNKKYSHYINSNKSYGLKLGKGERPIKRNKSGFINIKGLKKTKHFAAVLNTKSESSFSSQEFDNYYDNFLKNLQEDSVEKNNNVYNPSTRKDKHNKSGKSSGVGSSKPKRTSMQYKPYILVNQKSENNLDLQKSGVGNLPEIKISTFGSALTKPENSIEQSFGLAKAVLQNEESPSHHQIKLSLNDNDSKFTTNKQIEVDLTPTDKSIINGIPSNNEPNIELINNNNINNANNLYKNSQLSCTSPKSKVHSMQGSNILYVKQAENFTLGEQIFLHKTHSKEFPSTPKCNNHINHNIFIKPYKIQNTNERVPTCGNNNLFNVIQVNSINSFNNAQKINLCKNRNNTPLNGSSMNNNNKNKVTSKNPSPRYQFDYQSMNSSFDKGTKKNDLVIIHKTSSKALIKKGSNRNSHNNTPLLQFNQVQRIPSQRNDEQVFLSSDFELKDKNKFSYQEKQIIPQPPDNLQIKDSSHLKTKKYFFCIPCK